MAARGEPQASREQAAFALEQRLARTEPAERRRRGVFYTPVQVATAIVARVDQLLKTRFGLPLGLADPRRWCDFAPKSKVAAEIAPLPVIHILEPSAGSGIFLAAVIRQMHRNVTRSCREQGKHSGQAKSAWQRFFQEELPLRLSAMELMPEAIGAARITLAEVAEDTGLHARAAANIPLFCADALRREVHAQLSRPATVIVGNPPYAAASTNASRWIRELLRGRVDGQQLFRSYFHGEGNQPLNERKLWLHDDYVKFLRVAQWHIERAGLGVVGLVTNRGFLDNVTFRGLRYQLLDQFDQIEILDINGGGKGRGAAARLSRDESVFDVGQGVAISILAQSPPGQTPSSEVRFGTLWGTRERKLTELAETAWEELVSQSLSPLGPHYFLVPHRVELRDEYAQGVPITTLFPQSTSTIVTARDSVVIDTDRQRLLERIAAFRNDDLSDQQLRERFFPRPRSNNYPAGDTRGWKLRAARESLRADDDWQERIVPCDYRPWDRRWIYWSSAMVDWPRGDVMQEMTKPSATGLIVRRQMPPDRPCTFFFASSALTIDGILRSDNRGNETLIPQWVDGKENLRREALPEPFQQEPMASVFAYVYALFHSNRYRGHFAEHLRLDFPRVFFPRDRSTWDVFVRHGQQLLDLHLKGLSEQQDADSAIHPAGMVAAGYPKWSEGQVFIRRGVAIAEVAEADWLFHVGGHQVLRKWLKDRRHTELADDDVRRYRRIVPIIRETRQTMFLIDSAIEKLGGLHRALMIEPAAPSEGAAVDKAGG